MAPPDITTISVRRATRARLQQFGRYEDTTESIIARLLDHAEATGLRTYGEA